jgi:hypothetical protein
LTPEPPTSGEGGPGSWWGGHPDLAGVARRGRQELVADATESEHDAEQLRKRRRQMVDVCFEWMSRGDLVGIAAGAHTFTGKLVAAVNDLVTIQTETVRVAFNLDAIRFVRRDRVAAFPGSSGERSVGSFRAELGSHAVAARAVRLVGTGGGLEIDAVIDVVAEDHIVVTDTRGSRWMLPIRDVAFVVLDPAVRDRHREDPFDSG